MAGWLVCTTTHKCQWSTIGVICLLEFMSFFSQTRQPALTGAIARDGDSIVWVAILNETNCIGSSPASIPGFSPFFRSLGPIGESLGGGFSKKEKLQDFQDQKRMWPKTSADARSPGSLQVISMGPWPHSLAINWSNPAKMKKVTQPKNPTKKTPAHKNPNSQWCWALSAASHAPAEEVPAAESLVQVSTGVEP